ncbi:DUF805 domain-containing protein [Pseudaminobacter soli (ex Li et al. 2025)]|uniref:DUF805 domain-containing protein n=1 Tax=Pseudaminobacter soli (ex Li et al. 2025) TaxID=1295366 RepID=A0A2P7S5W9_9HYPH|nr:DUF805 domain-containing protein [Mesorhizobium soli]PSJ57847.1 DUF805 domain-containing protein [Mesorhizobium soli]
MDWKYLLTGWDGRINRAKFWAGIAALIVIAIVANLLDVVLGLHLGDHDVGVIGIVVSLVSIYFALALYAKRWHDRDKSGWWSLIGLVPLIGAVWILVELGILQGTSGANQYGPDPLA